MLSRVIKLHSAKLMAQRYAMSSGVRLMSHDSKYHDDHAEGASDFEKGLFHMDQYPVPHEPWQEVHDRMNTKYNIQLAAGLSFMFGTLFYVFFVSDAFKFMGTPPPMKNPSPVSAYKHNLDVDLP